MCLIKIVFVPGRLSALPFSSQPMFYVNGGHICISFYKAAAFQLHFNKSQSFTIQAAYIIWRQILAVKPTWQPPHTQTHTRTLLIYFKYHREMSVQCFTHSVGSVNFIYSGKHNKELLACMNINKFYSNWQFTVNLTQSTQMWNYIVSF